MLDTALMVWFVLTIFSTAYVPSVLLASTPAMGEMHRGWIHVVLSAGPAALIAYAHTRLQSARARQERGVPAAGTPERHPRTQHACPRTWGPLHGCDPPAGEPRRW